MIKLNKRLVFVSNRLPFAIDRYRKEMIIRPASGGLITAINPFLSRCGGLWVGWPGTFEDIDTKEISDLMKNSGYSVELVTLNKEEHDNFYYGFSNEILWPLFHDFQARCNFFNTDYWESYQAVNKRFAEAVAGVYSDNDYIWVQDYQLINVGQELRKLGVMSEIGFFLHTSFPTPDIFFKLPWREAILQAFLKYDLIGFQTLHDRNNFLQCVQIMTKNSNWFGKERIVAIEVNGKEIKVGYFPIGIDYSEFANQALLPEIVNQAENIRKNLLQTQIIFGVDRLDYTKGITCKLEAYRNALKRFPELHRKITLVQVIVPSRENIPEYNLMKAEIERLTSEINGQFTTPGWVPINYIFNSLNRNELLAYYCAADIALVTPLRDGMNLVAKEYCAANKNSEGVLVLSEFAGAANQLKNGALLVNPYNIEEVANAIYKGFLMGKNERKIRMQKMQKTLQEEDVFWWAQTFLKTSESQPSTNQNIKLVKGFAFNNRENNLLRRLHVFH